MLAALSSMAPHSVSVARGSLHAGACQRERNQGQSMLLDTHCCLVAGFFRLDGRTELLRQLDITTGAGGTLSDIELFARAWQRWGRGCSHYVQGDWVCVVRDNTDGSVWLARDATGNTGLYYWHDSTQLVFATSLPSLLAHPAVPCRPDAEMIARQLVVLPDPANDTATPYHDVRRLPGGHELVCAAGTIRLHGWWQPEAMPEFDWSERDCHEYLRVLFAEAVRDRLPPAGHAVAIMFSGGLDSAAVAAEAVAARGRDSEPLQALVAIPAFAASGAGAGRDGDESTLARCSAEHIGHVDLHLLAMPEASIMGSLRQMLTVHGRPGHAAVNQFWIHYLLQYAAERGVRRLLTGQGGNGALSWTGTGNLWSDLGRHPAAAARSVLRPAHGSVWNSMRQRLLKPLVLPLLEPWQRWRLSRHPQWTAQSAISEELVQQVRLDVLLKQALQGGLLGGSSNRRSPWLAQFRLGRLGSASLGATWMELGAYYGLTVCDPTRDRRLIEFCWRVPDRVFWADGLQRGLVRQGLRNHIPETVRLNSRRGLQAADIGHRLKLQAPAVREVLATIRQHALASAWLDVNRMEQALAELERQVSPATTRGAANILLRGLAVGLFLQRF